MDELEDLQQPDEARPTKRVKLDAPLAATEELQEEVADDDDWDNIYDDPTPPSLQEHVPKDVISASGQENGDIAVTYDLAEEDGNHDGGVPIEANGAAEEFLPTEEAQLVTKEPSVRMMEEITQVELGPIHTDWQAPNGINDGTATDAALAASAIDNGDSDPTAEVEAEAAAAPAMVADKKEDGMAVDTTLTQDPGFLAAAAVQADNKDAEWQFDSSDAESSGSDSDTTSDDDSADNPDSGSEDGYEMLDAATAAKILMSGDGDDDDGDKKHKGGDHQPRTANEVKEDIIPKPDVVVTEDMKITHVGDVERIVDNLVMVKGATPGEYQVLEVGSVLCNENREVVGAVADTFGRVQEPFYSVAFTNAQEIEEAGLSQGTKLFYVDSHSSFVFTQPLKNMKGTDASNIHDEEVGEDELEFSDDEAEQEYKRQRKAAKRGGRGNLSRSAFNEDRASRSFGAPGRDSGQTWISNSDAPAQQYGGGLSYEDGDAQDEFYSPLKRPDNLSQLMAGGNLPPRPPQLYHDRGRGRGRGFDRGRGRGDRGRGRGGFDRRGGRGGQNQDRNNRGARGGQDGFRGNAHSFPDRHNHDPASPQQHRANVQRSSPPQIHQHNPQYQQPQQRPTNVQSSPRQTQQQDPPYPQPPHQQQSYQFNGYTFQYPSPQPQAKFYTQPGPSANLSGTMYNQQMPAQWQQPQPQPQPAYNGWQFQQQQHAYAQPGAPPTAQQQQLNLAEIMKQLNGGYQQQQQQQQQR